MSFEALTKRLTGQDTHAASVIVEENQTALPADACGHATTALITELGALAETASAAETLELTAQLLGEMEITITSLRLDRGGLITLWKPSLTPAREAESA